MYVHSRTVCPILKYIHDESLRMRTQGFSFSNELVKIMMIRIFKYIYKDHIFKSVNSFKESHVLVKACSF